MSSRDIPVRVIREQLQQRAAELASMLAPGGRREGGIWSAPNPTRAGDARGSFKIWLTGASPGCFKEFDAGNSEKGDVIDLIAYAHFGDKSRRADAIKWAKDWLGLAHLDDAARDRLRRESEFRKRESAKREQEIDARKRRRAFTMWLWAEKTLAGTLAETYLASRGIPLAEIPHFEHGEMRFAPSLEWWKGAVYERQGGRSVKVKSGPSFPAIVSALRDWRGEITGVHCTFLAPDGAGKANRDDSSIDPPKLVYGQVAGSVIRLTRGPGDLTPEDWLRARRSEAPAQEGSPLVISEGIESGLSVALAAPEARVWAASSLGNLGNVYADHPCVSAVILAAENDQKPQAVAAFERAFAQLEQHGKPVTDMRPHLGNDFNDLL